MNLSSFTSFASESHTWLMFGLLLVAAGLLLAASAILLRGMRQDRSGRVIDQMLANRQQQTLAALRAATAPLGSSLSPGDEEEGTNTGAKGWRALFDRAAALGKRWSETRVGQYLIAAEDRLLLAQCGWDSVRAKSLFLFSRVALAAVLLLFVWIWLPGSGGLSTILRLLGAVGAGLLLPKFYVQRRAAQRRREIVEELPLLIDLLRLLQGVGCRWIRVCTWWCRTSVRCCPFFRRSSRTPTASTPPGAGAKRRWCGCGRCTTTTICARWCA